MLYIIVGPSGSGKTTFIRLALEHFSNCKVIPVDVYSPSNRKYRAYSGRRRISLKMFLQNQSNKIYSVTCNYLKGKYGFSIPKDYERKDVIYLLDYPGEYPQCKDISEFHWKGILILPPSVRILMKRLKKCNRLERLYSASDEYLECMDDIIHEKFDMSCWSIVINNKISDLQNIAHILLSKNDESLVVSKT